MKITPVSESLQQAIVTQYNQGKKNFDKIPLLPRNLNTGWPLLQVSLFFSNQKNGQKEYGLVLEGGNCHFAHIIPAAFAELLTKIPGIDIKITIDSKSVQKEDYNLNIFGTLLINGYEFNCKNIGLKLKSYTGGYGKIFELEMPKDEVGSCAAFTDLLSQASKLATKRKTEIPIMSPWHKEIFYTANDIQNLINENNAIFWEGQVYLDLGVLFEKVNNPQITEFFKALFKVEEFQLLEKPQELWTQLEKEQAQLQEEQEQTLLQDLINSNPVIANLYKKIEDMHNYGTQRKLKTEKSQIIMDIAEDLKASADNFFKDLLKTPLTDEKISNFKKAFMDILYDKNSLIDKHDAVWKTFAINFVIAISGVGLLLLAGKWAYSAKYEKRTTPFFNYTPKSVQKRDNVEDSLDEVDIVSLSKKSLM